MVAKHLELRVTPRYSDQNFGGVIHGSWILTQIDIAGGEYCSRLTGGIVVTAGIDRMKFIKPILPGDVVSMYVNHTQVTDTTATVRVIAEAKRGSKHPNTGILQTVAVAEVKYAAIDTANQPRTFIEQSV